MFRKWNPPPLVPQIEQKDHKPHGGFELDPIRCQKRKDHRGKGRGNSQDLRPKGQSP